MDKPVTGDWIPLEPASPKSRPSDTLSLPSSHSGNCPLPLPRPRARHAESTSGSKTFLARSRGSNYDILCDAAVELDSLPLPFLEAYPNPALLLVSSVPSTARSEDAFPWTPARLFGTIEPLQPVWTNASWKTLVCHETQYDKDQQRQETLRDYLTVDSLRRLGHWLSGCIDPTFQDGCTRVFRDFEAPRGVPDAGPSTRTVSCSALVLEFNFPTGPVLLELTRTSLPVHQLVDGKRTSIPTHTFVVLTTTPRSEPEAFVGRLPTNAAQHEAQPFPHRLLPPLQPPVLTSTIPSPFTPPSGQHDHFPSLEDMLRTETCAPSQPLFIHGDGTVSRMMPYPDLFTADGLPCNTNTLMDITDWAKTPLGDRENWSPSLRTLMQFLRTYPLSTGIWWGEEFTLFYNQMYADNVPNHPHPYGLSGSVAWAELWEALGPLAEIVIGGTPVFKEDSLVIVKDDNDMQTETYQTNMWLALDELDGSFGGIFHGLRCTTKRVIGERRSALLTDIISRTSVTRTVEEFYRSVVEALDEAPKDVPFAAMYTVNETVEKPGRTFLPVDPRPHKTVRLSCVGTVGIPEGHPTMPSSISLSIATDTPPSSPRRNTFAPSILSTPTMRVSISSQGGFSSFSGQSDPASSFASRSVSAFSSRCTSPVRPLGRLHDSDEVPWPIKQALMSGEPVLVEDCEDLIKDYPVRVWGELPSSAIVVPLSVGHQATPSLVLIIGLSCRLRFDEDYELFIQRLRNRIFEGYTTARTYQADALRIEDSEALDRAKNMLFTNVAYQLFTPLSLIAGPIDDMLVDMPSSSEKDGLMMARRHVRRLTRLVNILLDASRLEANSLKMSFRCVNLGTVTRDIAGLFSKTAGAAKIDFNLQCDTTPRDVYIDREMWEKMLFNLIGNACDYTREGSVTVSVSYTEHEAVFFVKDTGVGISAVELQHMFVEGTGMALSFTKKLAEIHHGTLEIESRTAEESSDGSHGTKCTVRIPLGTDHLAPNVIGMATDPDMPAGGGMTAEDIRNWYSEWAGATWMSDSSASSVAVPQSPSAVSRATDSNISPAGSDWSPVDGCISVGSSGDYLSRRAGVNLQPFGSRLKGIDPSTLFFTSEDVVMVVDNNFDTRRYIRSIFEPFCKVAEARDGREALDKFAKVNPDVIIADAKLPRVDGFELLQALRSGTRQQRLVPFVLLEPFKESHGKYGANADDYISKPFNARELVARVHMQLQIGKRRKALEEMFDRRTTELRTLHEGSPIGIFRATKEGLFVYANPAWHALTGCIMQSDAGAPPDWTENVVEEERQGLFDRWLSFYHSDRMEHHDMALHKNGKYISSVIVRLDPKLHGSDGFLGYLIDLTERKLNEELQRQRVVDAEKRQAEAEAAKRQQELLIDITSHEIRNPISSLMQMSVTPPFTSLFPC